MQFGSRGWQHRTWLGSFYPDDLPLEWRLPYYCNEFDTVLIPSNELLNTGREQVEEWLEDSADNFSFFVEIDGNHEISFQFHIAQALLPQLAGVVLDKAIDEFAIAAENIKVLATNLLGNQIQIYAPDSNKNTTIAAHGVDLVYNVRGQALSGGRCLGLLRSDSISTKELAGLLGKLEKIDGGCEALFIAGPKPEIELLRQASDIYDLSY